MFDNLSNHLTSSLNRIRGRAKLTEDNIRDVLREVRIALLEADVALPVVKDFITAVKYRAVGTEVSKSLSPGQVFLKIVKQELENVMGQANDELNLRVARPAVILMTGLQGAGKTTSVAKLAKYLQERYKKSVSVVSTDVYRPAAIEQLETLAAEVGADFIPSASSQKPVDIANNAIDYMRKVHKDVLIVDTAGRLAIDEDMMAEIKTLHAVINPIETLFVVDAMMGQDAANTAKDFGDVLSLTGVILTKIDGDARGGAALSVRHITGKPIKFLSVGEKTDALEPFYPDRLVSRILGMGDMFSLIEEVEKKIDKEKAEKLTGKLKKGTGFDLEDFKEQLQQMKNMGVMSSMLDKFPGMGQMGNIQSKVSDEMFVQMEALINSMTITERQNSNVINGSRKKRISTGAGLQIQDLNRLLKQHKQMKKMMKKMSVKGGMKKMMRGLGSLVSGGSMPGGGNLPKF